MEDEPDSRTVYIEFPSGTYECDPERTTVYLHQGEHRVFDHIFVVNKTDPDVPESGLAFFREVITNFDETITMMQDRQFAFVDKKKATEHDQQAYREYFNMDPLLKEVPSYDLTPRMESLVQRFGTAMLNMPPDMLYEELTTPHDRPHTEKWRAT
jgi:hypothetical protein